ncbi:hypothetical protein PW5551_02390 [Petrotoga sp. 9PW.55.5.1]|uniref:Asp23/Gls24 family envelope stress response protein n=1 Tax=Petrotoga sp. 9PW.55.5.1 TaxID=1308979 RepID=UPI000DC58916|nr:Asp23/Gls24 family envelope stress response protein [Petrotoga sp. 9PW.55.5.1]RAO99633.1 hypothetical protein PW5551_02390 [Petrotoga sp. 9PW.55.5.1]
MPLNEENDYGEIITSENVLKDLVFKTVETFLKSQKMYNDKIQKDLQKSIKIVVNDDQSVSVSLKLPAKYGENIVEFSKEVQKSIKEDLEKIAEAYVSNVDIAIENLVRPEELQEEYEELEGEVEETSAVNKELTDEEEGEEQKKQDE